MTLKEFKEMKILKEKIFGKNMFIELDPENPEAMRYNELMGKYLIARKAALDAEKDYYKSIALGGPPIYDSSRI
jgi:hypothetical protein